MVLEGKKPKDLGKTATDLQSSIGALRVLLTDKDLSWKSVLAAASSRSEEAIEEQWSLLQTGKLSKSELTLGAQLQSLWLVLEAVARLAIDVEDACGRLAKLEKDIENLRSAKK